MHALNLQQKDFPSKAKLVRVQKWLSKVLSGLYPVFMDHFFHQFCVLKFSWVCTLELDIQSSEAFLQRIFWTGVNHLFADCNIIITPV